AEEIGVSHLQPQCTPPARRMAGQEAGIGFRDRAEFLFKVWDEFFSERPAPRAVVDRIGELVMPAGAGAVEVNVEHLSRLPFTDLSRELLPLPPRGSVIPAEAVNVIDRRVEFFRVRAVTRRQHYPGAHGDGAPMKRGQHRALEFDE